MKDREQHRLSGEPFFLVRFHHPPRVVVARIIGVGEKAANMIAPAHVAVLRLLQETREQGQRERMAAEIARGRLQLARRPKRHCREQRRADFVRQVRHDDRRRAVLPARDVRDRDAAGQHDQAGAAPGGSAAKRRSSARKP